MCCEELCLEATLLGLIGGFVCWPLRRSSLDILEPTGLNDPSRLEGAH